MKSETVNVYSVFSILDSLVGTKVEGEILDIVAERLVEKTERQAGPETAKDWVRIECAFEETSMEQESPFACSAYERASKIAGDRAKAMLTI